MTPSQNRTGIVLVLASATGFASKAIFVKLAYGYGVDAITLLALRMLAALAFLLPWMAWKAWRTPATQPRQPLSRNQWGWILGLGLVGYYLSSLLDFMGLMHISASLERLILFLYPTLTVLMSAVWFRKPIVPATWLALLLSYAGIALVVSHDISPPGSEFWLGVSLVAASTLTFAFYLTGSQSLIARIGSGRFTEWMLIVSGAMLLAQFLALRPLSALILPWQVYACALAMGLLSTVLPIYWMAAGLGKIGASRAAMLSSAGPPLMLLMGAIFLGERLTGWQLAGAALVFAGVWVTSRQK